MPRAAIQKRENGSKRVVRSAGPEAMRDPPKH